MAALIKVTTDDGRSRSCSAICYDAKGPWCNCICGGAYHGHGLSGAIDLIKRDVQGGGWALGKGVAVSTSWNKNKPKVMGTVAHLDAACLHLALGIVETQLRKDAEAATIHYDGYNPDSTLEEALASVSAPE